MRVIAGSARRLILKTVEGSDTRPTTDRIKETLFNMLQNSLYDCCFLDLFSGSGAIGIEALSRGAAKAVFVENSKAAVLCIQENLRTTKLEDRGVVITADVLTALRRLDDEGMVFDFVFMDPPYNCEHEKQVLEYLSTSDLINSDSQIIIEASKETVIDYAQEFGFTINKEKNYKTNKHIFVSKGE